MFFLSNNNKDSFEISEKIRFATARTTDNRKTIFSIQ